MPADMTVYNPNGPAAVFQRICYSAVAQVGYGSPGLSPGWTHNYDITVYGPQAAGTWGALTLVYANDAQEALTPALSNGSPTGAFTVPAGRPYAVSGVPGSTPGQWQSVTLTWDDQTQWVFTPLVVNGVTEYALTTITNRTGQSLLLAWDGRRALQSVTDATSGTSLLTLAYDGNGNLSTLTDAYGRQVDYTFATDQLTGATVLTSASQVATGPGAPARATYGYFPINAAPLLSSVAVPSPTGSGTSTDGITYDGNGRVIFFTDGNGNTTAYTYNGGSTQVQTLNPSGTVILAYSESYDAMGRDTGTTDAAGYFTQIAYTDANNPYKPTQVTDKLGHVTTYTYDPYGHMLTKTDPRGVVTTDTWSYAAFALGRLMKVQVGSRTPTTYTYYEPVGLVKTITAAVPGGGSGTSTYTYDALGDMATAATPGNNATATRTITYGYGSSPAVQEPLTVTDELGHVTTYAYTARGQVRSVVDALGNETDYAYTLADQVQQVLSPATGQQGGGRVTDTGAYLYPGGPLMGVTRTDEGGTTIRQVSYGRGGEGELLSVSGSAEPVTYTYDALYRVAALTDGAGHTTHYFYNSLGYLSQVAYPGAGSPTAPLAAGTKDTVSYTSFDKGGNVLTRVDGDGTTTTYTYNDPESRLTNVHYAPGSGVSALADTAYTYDGYGRRATMADATGSQSYAYDDTDHVLSDTTTYAGLPAKTIGYGYNPDGSRSSMNTPAGSFGYAYDAAGRMTSLTNPFEAYPYSFAYYANDWLQSQQSSNVMLATYAYDAAGQLTDLNNHRTDNLALSDFAVPARGGYDGAGNRVGLTVSMPAAPGYAGQTSDAYDTRDELTQETSTRNGGYSNAFAYDGAENPTTFRGASVGAASADNQLPGSTYDGDGSPTTYKGGGATYDPEARLTGYGGVTSAYNGDGLRAVKAAGGVATYFLYDGDQPVVEMSAAGAVTAANTFGPNGLLARHTSSGSALYTWDLSGSLAQRESTSGTNLDSALSDGFGASVTTDGTADPFSGFGGQWGGYTDAQDGLTLFTHREYDTSTGRFLTRDPSGYDGGINLYGYTSNDPISLSDPSGLMPLPVNWPVVFSGPPPSAIRQLGQRMEGYGAPSQDGYIGVGTIGGLLATGGSAIYMVNNFNNPAGLGWDTFAGLGSIYGGVTTWGAGWGIAGYGGAAVVGGGTLAIGGAAVAIGATAVAGWNIGTDIGNSAGATAVANWIGTQVGNAENGFQSPYGPGGDLGGPGAGGPGSGGRGGSGGSAGGVGGSNSSGNTIVKN